jgi:adenylyltransferase/sulfurtransferase
MVLPEVGHAGQERLASAAVAVVGAGGLGAPVLAYLAAAGVGRLGLIDFDRVETSNLHRQVLFGTGDVGRPKVEAAAERLRDLAPGTTLDLHPVRLEPSNADRVLAPYDVVVDGTDRIETRYAINDACLRLGRPFVYGSVYRFEGQVAVFAAEDGPCFRCLLPVPPEPGSVPDCAQGGVLGAVPGVVGSLQAAEALKLLLGTGRPLIGRMLVVDTLASSMLEFRVPRIAGCDGCGRRRTAPARSGTPEAEAPTDVAPRPGPDIHVDELASRMKDTARPAVLLDVRTAGERTIGCIPGDVWIPMHELEARIGELDPARETIVYCHLGTRSAMVCGYLARTHGFRRVRNLNGGIDAWSRRIDPTVPRY